MERKDFAEFIQALEMREPRTGCLTDEQLAALGSRAAGEVDDEALRRHLLSCLACLQAYASLQAVLELPVGRPATEVGRRHEAVGARLSRLSRRIMARTRRVMAVPVPLSWSAGAVVAVTLLLHLVATRSFWSAPPPVPPAAGPATTATAEHPAGAEPGDIRTATASSSPCGSKRWRIESVITRNLISHLFVCGDGSPDDAVYVISGRPSDVTQRPGQTSAILEQARIQRLDAS
jgi:hypothetical protein